MTTLYLTVAEAAALLNVSRGTLERGIRSGTVPHVRPGGPGGSIRIPRAWVEHGWQEEANDAAQGLGVGVSLPPVALLPAR